MRVRCPVSRDKQTRGRCPIARMTRMRHWTTGHHENHLASAIIALTPPAWQKSDDTLNMKLYVTYGSPYARLARIIVIEKALEDRVEIIEAKTRTPGSPYYRMNPSGRVPYCTDDTGVGLEDSQLISAYLDSLDGQPRFHNASHASDWAYLRFEFAARSMCDGIAVWGREMARPKNERSPTTLAHEAARAQRMADFFEHRATDPVMQGSPCMAHLIIAVAVEMARKRGLDDLSAGRPRLANWMRPISDLPSMQGTAPP